MADADPQRSPKVATATPLDAAPDTPVRRRRWLRPVMMLGVPLLIAMVGAYFWLTEGRFVSTDNAYVSQDKVAVSADVAGRIVEVAVRENQQVKPGDLLFRIDPDPYRIAVAQANAAIANAQVEVQTLQTSFQGTSADIRAAQDQLVNAQQDYRRQAELMASGFTTRARLEQAEHAVEQARPPSPMHRPPPPRRGRSSRPGRRCPDRTRRSRRRRLAATRRRSTCRAPPSARRSAGRSARPTGCRSGR